MFNLFENDYLSPSHNFLIGTPLIIIMIMRKHNQMSAKNCFLQELKFIQPWYETVLNCGCSLYQIWKFHKLLQNQHTSCRYTNLVVIMMAKKGNGKRSPETTRSSWFFAAPPRGVELHEKDAAVLNQKWSIKMQKCVSK